MSTRRGTAQVTGPNTHRTKGGTDAQREALRARAYDLRIRGLTLRQIGEQLNVHHSTVHTLLREEISNRVDPLKDQYLQYELDRLDHMQQATLVVLDNPGRIVSALNEAGDLVNVVIVDDKKILGAIDRLVRISESRRKLIGLDAPVKVQADVNVTETTEADRELAELVNEAKARAAAAADKIRNGSE